MGNFTRAPLGGTLFLFASEEQNKKQAAYTLSTQRKYVDAPIRLVVNVPGINLQANDSFYINDGINTWNWSIDEDGNVLIE